MGGGCQGRRGHVGERLAGGGAAGGDEDLVSGEAKVRIGELGGELAERGREIGGDWGSGDGDCGLGGHVGGGGWSLSLRMA